MRRISPTELFGMLLGVPLAGPVALGTALRGSRLLHSRGLVLVGHAEAVAHEEPWRSLACALDGPVVARLSGALFKRREGPDVLGCALRFLRDPRAALDPAPDDQDLLLATVRSPWLLPFAPFSTNASDFSANTYHGVSPFYAPDLPRVTLRLSPMPVHGAGHTREERLLDALADGPVRMRLDARPARRVSRHHPLLSIALTAPLAIDQRQLRFDPFRDGRGLTPTGLVHHLRVATYAAAQRVRPRPEASPPPPPIPRPPPPFVEIDQ